MKGGALFLFVWIFHSTQVSHSQRQNGGGLDYSLEGIINAMETGAERANNPLFSLVPTTPSPDEVNCYVEIPAIRLGGQCVRLGRVRWTGRDSQRRSTMAWGCRSGIHLDISSPDCYSQNRRSRRVGG